MPIDILMPPLSQTMDSLVLVEWAKKVGDPVTKGEALFVVETDKATLEVESPGTGILREILAKPGSDVPVKSRIGVIAVPGEVAEGLPPAGGARRLAPGASGPAIQGTSEGAPASLPTAGLAATLPPGAWDALPAVRRNRIFASPRARGLATREGVPIHEVQATGPQSLIVERDVRAYLEAQRERPKVTPLAWRVAAEAGVDPRTLAPADGERITRADVESALGARAGEATTGGAAGSGQMAGIAIAGPATAAPPVRSRRVALSTLRKTIARRMQASHQATAPVTLTRDVDATELKQLRSRILQELGEAEVRPSYTDFLVKIVARCLSRHPQLNAHFAGGDALEVYDDVHMALAVDTERGLLAPVIRAAGQKGLLELARARAALARRAQEGTLTPEELSGGTFTITNLGPLGVDAFTPLINPPQTAILGVGRLRSVPAAFEGQIALREMMFLSLTFDHRIVDGAPAARFLADVVQLVEKPHLIWL